MRYESLTEILQSIFATGCYWGTQSHIPIWVRALQRVAKPGGPPGGGYYEIWLWGVQFAQDNDGKFHLRLWRLLLNAKFLFRIASSFLFTCWFAVGSPASCVNNDSASDT